jgi:hypothetical protein
VLVLHCEPEDGGLQVRIFAFPGHTQEPASQQPRTLGILGRSGHGAPASLLMGLGRHTRCFGLGSSGTLAGPDAPHVLVC